MPIPDIQTPVQRDNTAIHFLPTKDGNEYLQGELYLAAKRQMEREQKEREEAERKARQERFANMSDAERQSWVQEQWDKTEGLGEADSATDWYHAIEEDPYKEAEWDRNAALTAAIGSNIVTGGIGLGNAIVDFGLIPALASEVAATAGGMASYEFGEYLDNKFGTKWIAPTLGFIGGGGSGMAVSRSSPMQIRTMLHQAKKLDWSNEGITIPSSIPNWKYNKVAQYDNGTINAPLFARKSQLAHELGHYVGDKAVADPSKVKGAFTPGYEYSPNATFEQNAAENFADYFKTKLGYPYKGKDLNLIARQNIINNNETNWFGDVVRNDQRLYELSVPRKKVDLLTGIKNIRSFLKQAKDGEQFRNSVYYPVRRYMSNASILNQNFGGTNNTWVIPKPEDLLRSTQNVKISTKFKPIRQLFAKGSYSPNTDEVWLSRFYPSLWKKAWRNPNKAIQIMHGTASHEGTHLALNHLNVSPSINGNGYYISNTLHPLYQDVLYAFSDPTRDATKWMRSPEEFIAEMNKWKLRYNTPEHVGFNQLRPDIKNRTIKNLSKRFNFTPEDAEYIATKFSDFGYKNGGKLNS